MILGVNVGHMYIMTNSNLTVEHLHNTSYKLSNNDFVALL